MSCGKDHDMNRVVNLTGCLYDQLFGMIIRIIGFISFQILYVTTIVVYIPRASNVNIFKVNHF